MTFRLIFTLTQSMNMHLDEVNCRFRSDATKYHIERTGASDLCVSANQSIGPTRTLCQLASTSSIRLVLWTDRKSNKSYCSYNKQLKQHFIVATTKMLMRAATVVRRRQLRSIAVAAQDSAAEHCDGSRLRG